MNIYNWSYNLASRIFLVLKESLSSNVMQLSAIKFNGMLRHSLATLEGE